MNSDNGHLRDSPRRSPLMLGLVIALCIGGALARMVYVEEFPFPIHNDETSSIVDGIRHFMPGQRGGWALFGSAFGGHPNLSYWLSAIPSRLIGEVTLWSARLGASIFGTLSMILFALFASKAFGRTVGIFFLVLILPYHFHVHFSRTAFPYIHALVGMAAVSLAFVWYVERPAIGRALVVGVLMGLAALTYPATHVLPAAIACAVMLGVLPRLVRERGGWKGSIDTLLMTGAFIVGILISLSPEIVHAMRYGYTSRLSSTFIFHPHNIKHLSPFVGIPKPTPFDVLLFNLWRTCDIFYKADSAEQYQFNDNPLPVWGAALGVVGALVLLWRSFKLQPIPIYIVSTTLFTIIASALMVEGNFSPHQIVLALIIPLAMAIGWKALLDLVRCKHVAMVGVVTGVLGVAWVWWNWEFYNMVVSPLRSRLGRIPNYILRLPIDKEGVTEVLGVAFHNVGPNESYYQLIYPNSRQVQLSKETSADQIYQRVSEGPGRVVILEDMDNLSNVEAVFKAHGRDVQVFVYPNMPVGFLYVK
jgi:Dolichyl-phosphate-mannose-protein mannosyltransferase